MRAWTWLLALAVGCGPATPRPERVTPAPAPPLLEVAAEEPEPRVVRQPEHLRAIVRAANVERDWERLGRVVPQFKAFVAGLGVGPHAVVQRLVGVSLTKEVDLSRPVELAAYGDETTGGPSLMAVLAVRDFVASKERIEAAFETTVRLGGAIRIRSARREGDAESIPEDTRCELHQAPRGREGRLVCAQDARLDPHMAAYLAARDPTDANDQAMLDVTLTGSMFGKFAGEIEDDNRDRTDVERFGARPLLQFLRDLGSLGLEVRLGEDDLAVELRLGFQRTESIVSSTALGTGEAGALPDAFWRLPEQASFAFWLQGMPPGRRTAENVALAREFMALIPKTVLDPAGREPAAQAYLRGIHLEGPMIYASGLDLGLTATEVAGFLAGSQSRAALQRLREHSVPWTLYGSPRPMDERVVALRESIRVDKEYSRVRTRDARRARPHQAPRGVGPELPQLGYLREAPPPRRLGFPAGTVRFVHAWLANPEYVVRDGELPPTDSSEYIHLLAADGYTWTCKAAREASCAPLLRQIAKGERTLADQPELQHLRKVSGSIIGTTNAAGLVGHIVSTRTASDIESAQSLLAGTATLPRGGTTPVLVSAVVTPDESGPGSLRFRTHVSHEQLLGWIGAALASVNDDSGE